MCGGAFSNSPCAAKLASAFSSNYRNHKSDQCHHLQIARGEKRPGRLLNPPADNLEFDMKLTKCFEKLPDSLVESEAYVLI